MKTSNRIVSMTPFGPTRIARRPRPALAALGAAIGVAGCLFASLPALAVRITAAPGGNALAASAPGGAVVQPVATLTDESASLRSGTIEAVDAGKRVKVNDTWLDIVVGETRLFRAGVAVRPEALKTGQPIKFTLARSKPSTPEPKADKIDPTQKAKKDENADLKIDPKSELNVLRVVYLQ